MNQQRPREIALGVLIQRDRRGGFTEALIERAPGWSDLNDLDRRWVRELVSGAVRWERTLDWLINRQCRKSPPTGKLRMACRMGLYQLFFMNRIPPHAVLFETVEAAKRCGLRGRTGFLNAILRHYDRERQDIPALLEKLRREQPAVGWSHPDWLYDRWVKFWGQVEVGRLLQWNNQPGPVFARLNTLQADAESLRAAWREEEIDFEEVPPTKTGGAVFFCLPHSGALNRLPSFRKGWFFIQDPGTHLAVDLVAARPGERILDACAAPGGKTVALAAGMGEAADILASDSVASRRESLRENLDRLGLQRIPVLEPAQVTGTFDRVLVDAPCSNTGVLRRRLDVRWRLSEQELDRLVQLQAGILDEHAPRVRPGGSLIYSTCSLEPEENEGQLHAFVERHPEFVIEEQRASLPWRDEMDGAYAGRLVRRAAS